MVTNSVTTFIHFFFSFKRYEIWFEIIILKTASARDYQAFIVKYFYHYRIETSELCQELEFHKNVEHEKEKEEDKENEKEKNSDILSQLQLFIFNKNSSWM